MGILKDTYIVNKTDNSSIVNELKRKNDIEQEYLLLSEQTKDRVNISLNEYEKLKDKLKDTTDSLKCYENFIVNLSKKLMIDPELLLKSNIKENRVSRNIMTMKDELYVIFELEVRE